MKLIKLELNSNSSLVLQIIFFFYLLPQNAILFYYLVLHYFYCHSLPIIISLALLLHLQLFKVLPSKQTQHKKKSKNKIQEGSDIGH